MPRADCRGGSRDARSPDRLWTSSCPTLYNEATASKRGSMNDDRKVTLYHSPNTRSSGGLILLEELGAPYELHVLNMKAGEQRRPQYLAINPMGKVPALKHV